MVLLRTLDETLFGTGGFTCLYYIVDIPFKQFGRIAVGKNFPLLRKLNKIAIKFREHGLSDALQRRYVQPAYCDALSSDSLIDEGNGLYSVHSGFFLFIFGMAIGVVVFLIELMVKFLKKPRF